MCALMYLVSVIKSYLRFVAVSCLLVGSAGCVSTESTVSAGTTNSADANSIRPPLTKEIDYPPLFDRAGEHSTWQLQVGNYVTFGKLSFESASSDDELEGQWRFVSNTKDNDKAVTEAVFNAQGLVAIPRLDSRKLDLRLKVIEPLDTTDNKVSVSVMLENLIYGHYLCEPWQVQYSGRWREYSQFCSASANNASIKQNMPKGLQQPAHTNRITYNGLTVWAPFINQIIKLTPIK